MILDIFPWQRQQWQNVIASKHDNRLPHALLLAGIQGLGKKHFALHLAHTLLCNTGADMPCGQCHACQLSRAQSHPDLLVVEPEKSGHMIKVDQVREVVHFANETALQGGRRVIIFNPANAMNINAANALLKTLEEPAPNTLIVLISDENSRLPATIISRCQKIVFHQPKTEIAMAWVRSQLQESQVDLHILLNLANGAPLKALELASSTIFSLRQTLYQGLESLARRQADPLKLSAELQDQDEQILLNLLLYWLQDLLRFKLTEGHAELMNYDYQRAFTELAQTYSYKSLLAYHDQVKETYANVMKLNLNRQLMIEDLLIRWVHYAAC